MGQRQPGTQFHNNNGPGSQKQENPAHCHQQIAPGIATQTQSYQERQPVYIY
jgi:hypothetical protein